MRKFSPISVSELQGKIELKKLNYEDWDDYYYRELTPQIEKDLAKVVFDCENIDTKPWTRTINPLMGYNTLDNGLSFLGITAGGDWEAPIFFIIYFDGNKLRGYIPEKGNTWDVENRIAYGNNNTNADDAPEFNSVEIVRDIKARIKPL